MVKNILVIDDDPLALKSVERFLKGRGYYVSAVCSGVEALEQIKSHSFDFIISDIRMPQMNGIETLQRIREIHHPLPAVIMIGDSADESYRQSSSLGIVGYLYKPFELEELLNIIEKGVQKQPKERRTHPRIGVSLPIRLKFLGVNQDSQQESDAEVSNLSEGGICFITKKRFSSDESLEIIFDSPLPSKPIGIEAKILWSDYLSKTNQFRHGVSFTPTSEEVEQSIIKSILSKYQIDSRLMAFTEDEFLKSIEFHVEKRYKKLRKAYDRESINTKVDYFSELIGKPLRHIKGCTYNTNYFRGNIENPIGIAQIPLGIAGPISINGKNTQGNFYVPMATTEGALILTYDFGMRLLQLSEPVETEVVSNVIHLDPMFPIRKNEDVCIVKFVDENFHEIKKIAESGSQHLALLKIEDHRIENNLVLQFFYDTCDAHGLNMINYATFNACKFIEAKTGVFFYHRSHYSGVKHYSPLNEKMGYGRVVKASVVLSLKTLKMLGVTAKELKEFFDRCTEVAHATGISSVNVHAANAIAAIFIACGQDVADVSSSAVCSTTTELANGGECLRITCTLRNLLVGTVGGGTGLGTQSECLKIMGCLGSGKSNKFAEIIAATVLAGEFPTASAVINRTYIAMHEQYGRNKNKLIDD